jgi:anti-sigma factor RsiW
VITISLSNQKNRKTKKEEIFMKCGTEDKLSQFADSMLTEKEHVEICTHLKNCDHCTHVVKAFKKEQFILKQTLQLPTLPNNFASKILEQLEPY